MCMFGNICVSFLHRDLRFIEVVENVCQRLLEYNLHKERAGSNRFAKVRECGCVWHNFMRLFVSCNAYRGCVFFRNAF